MLPFLCFKQIFVNTFFIISFTKNIQQKIKINDFNRTDKRS